MSEREREIIRRLAVNSAPLPLAECYRCWQRFPCLCVRNAARHIRHTKKDA